MAATVLTQLVASVKLPEMLQITLDQQIAKYVDGVAACERLQKQPIPVAYTRYTYSYVFTLNPIRMACFACMRGNTLPGLIVSQVLSVAADAVAGCLKKCAGCLVCVQCCKVRP